MAVNIPAAVNLHTADPDTDKRSNIGTPGNVAVKAAGNLPITTNAGQFQINASTDGILWPFTTVDVSSDTKLLVWSWQHNAPNRIQQNTQANGGAIIRIGTGTGSTNYRDFYVSGNDTPAGSSQTGPIPIVVDLNSTAHDATSGTFDNTDVQAYGLAITFQAIAGTSAAWVFVQRAHIFDTDKNATNIVKFTGTSDFDDIITGVLGTSYTTKIGNWVQRIDTTYIVPIAFQIGDTSTATNFDCVGKTVIFPASNDSADPRYRYTTQGGRVYIVLRDNALDDADLDGSTWKWGVASPFDLNVSNLSAITIEGASFQGMGEFTVGSSVTGGATFTLNGSSKVVCNGADLDGSTINGDMDLNSATDLTDVTIDGDLRIATGADSTLTFSNVTVTGDVYNDSASNTLVISATNGSSMTAGDAGTGNGQTDIQNAVTVQVTVQNVSGTKIESARVLIEADSGGALPAEESCTITRSVSTATVTHTAHGLSNNDYVIIRDANEQEYNGEHQITWISANSYSYTVSGSPATPATGSITSSARIVNELTNVSGVASESFNYGADQPIKGVARKSTSSPYYKTGAISGSISSAGFSATVTLILDEA